MLRIADNQRYQCRRCGECCRHSWVAVAPVEIEAIARLPWPSGSPVESYYQVFRHRPYLKKDQSSHGCVFLDGQHRCQMHKVFGGKCKPLTCRAYPFEFMRLWGDVISVAARYDCPAIMAGAGAPLESLRSDLEEIVGDELLQLGGGLTEAEMDGLSREAVIYLGEFLASEIDRGTPVPALRLAMERLDKLGRTFANDLETLKLVLPSMVTKAAAVSVVPPGASWPERNRLRNDLLGYLRRDNELTDYGLGTRLRRAAQAAALFFGGGNPADFSASHPDVSIRQAKIFDESKWTEPPEAFVSHRNFLHTRLYSLQFFGKAGHGAAFFAGLDGLLGSWESATLLARLHAAAAGRTTLCREDGDYATAVIDHTLGRVVR